MSTLDQLRDQIRTVDLELIELIARRLNLAVEVGRLKERMGKPIRDWSVEKQVIERARHTALKLDLPGDLVKNIMQLLIRESCAFQEGLQDSAYGGDPGKICIVGGRGRMGRWFARFFQNQGHALSIFDTAGGLTDFPPRTVYQTASPELL